jgi:uncharacterized membrane protein YfcA
MAYNAPMDQLATFIVVGFLAQLIDGTLGMAYGLSATTFLLTAGISPAVASASVHAAEVITTGVSGLAHWNSGNVSGYLVRRLVIPGMIGAAVGAYLLSSLPGDRIKPFVSAYLLAMGAFIVWKGIRRAAVHKEVRSHLIPLGLGGGFLDAVGGGGWGPIVVSNLVARGNHPRYSIGSVNFAEFFVASAASGMFVLTIGLSFWTAILGLAVGGAAAAPLAARLTKRVPTRALMIVVGIMIVALSVRTLYTVMR